MKTNVCLLIIALQSLFLVQLNAQKRVLPMVVKAADARIIGTGPKVTNHENGSIMENITLGSSLEYADIQMERAGIYRFEVQYLTGDTDRPMVITVNNYDPAKVTFRETTSSWGNPVDAKKVISYLHFDAGRNTITMAPIKTFGPNLVQFVISESDKYSNRNVYSYDLTDDANITLTDNNSTASNLVDNDCSTIYTVKDKKTTSILVDCHTPVLLTGYLLSAGKDSEEDVTQWTLESSADKKSWQAVRPASTEKNGYSSMFHVAREADAIAGSLARYYRLTVNCTASVEVGEFQLFGISSMNGRLFHDDLMTGVSTADNTSASPEGSKGHRYGHLFDRDISTKYYGESATTFLVVAEPSKPSKLNYYTLTSCANAIDRDLRSWDVEGYTGYTWEVIDEVRDFFFPCRLATMRFNVNTSKGYQAFRLRMKETNGSSNFQLLQWQIFGEAGVLDEQTQKEWKKAKSPITTPWYDTLTPANVLNEYPRPQLVRKDWMNLNGVWDFKESAGMGKYRPNQRFDKKVLVPFPIESALSGLMLTDHEERPYKTYLYRRSFTVPTEMKGKNIILHFGAVDWKCEVFVNGIGVGTHTGGYDPFSFDITAALNAGGEQEVQVQFMDPTDAGGQPVGKQKIKHGGIFYTPSSGIWQTVWLEGVGANHISSIEITPDVDRSAVKIKVYEKQFSSSQVAIKIYDNGALVAQQTGKAFSTIEVPIVQPKLWSPDSPSLYDVKIELLNNNVPIDEVGSYFGMRKIAVGQFNGKACFMLNNKPIFLFGPLDQGFWPDGLHTAPSDEALIFDVEKTKAFGFNMTRKHIKTEPARWYYHCDRLGLMVMQDMVNAGSDQNLLGNDEWVRNNFLKESGNIVNSLKNHPSIVSWIAFNEGFGQYAANSAHTQSAYSKIKSLDNTRVISSASGWVIFDNIGEVADMHSYPRPGIFPNTSSKRISMCGEYGGITFVVKDHVWKNSDMVYVSVNSGEELKELFNSYTDLLKPLYSDGLGAAVYTQLTDLEGEVNGLITYDRKVVKANAQQLTTMRKGITDVINYSSKEILPTALRAKNAQWKYTTTMPAGNWKAPAYNDSSWKTGVSGFGDGGAPNTTYDNKTTVNTEWRSNSIYLRNTFKLTAEEVKMKEKLRVILYHDDDCEVYINGVLAFKASGYTSNYALFDITAAAKNALKQGDNTIAISCKQFSGGQYIDAGLILENYSRNDNQSTATILPPNSKESFYLVPNPTKDYCTIEGGDNESIRSVQLFSLSGKSEGYSECERIDTSRMDKGVYLVQIATDKTRHSLKLIKE